MKTLLALVAVACVLGTVNMADAQVVTYYSPVVTPAPALVPAAGPTVVYRPAPVVTYYAPAPTVVYSPVPTVVAPVPAPVYVGRPAVIRSKVYYRGQPVRNLLRAVTP